MGASPVRAGAEREPRRVTAGAAPLPLRGAPAPVSSAQESQEAGDDQVEGDNVVQQSRHHQDEDPGDQRDKRCQGNVRHARYRTGD